MKNPALYSSLNRFTAVLLLSAMSLSLSFGGCYVSAQEQTTRENPSTLNNQSESLFDKYTVNLTAISVNIDDSSSDLPGKVRTKRGKQVVFQRELHASAGEALRDMKSWLIAMKELVGKF